ncbi:hypothetical protein C8R43DRAFT_890087 [Mycena crocata]|nr:hypothetical protein C8R43DRAFT_890087 [Mycena crocata]
MLAQVFLHLVTAFSTVFAATPAILLPAKGSAIAPNASFPFKYHSIADYGVSSYNFSVWLFTSPPRFFEPSESFAAGYHFGRYSLSNYPGNPSPHNLPPSAFKMPDFSRLGGGWGVGAPATHATFYFAVIEEYGEGLVRFSGLVAIVADGRYSHRLAIGELVSCPIILAQTVRMSLSVNQIIYNATHR